MSTRNVLLVSGLILTGSMSMGVAGASPEQTGSSVAHPVYAARRIDQAPNPWQSSPSERAEFAAMDTASAISMVNEPAYSGRRADHILMLMNSRRGGERAEFAAFDGQSATQGGTVHSEPAYSGRRADHLELLR